MNIIITGASRGIGFEIVKQLSESPENNIVAVSRNMERLEILKQQCKNINPDANVYPVGLDLNNRDLADSMVNEVLSFIPSVDILVNNAGLLINKSFGELSDMDIDLMFETNVKSVFRLIRILLPYFNKESHIVNISSMGGFQGSAKFPGLSAYSASKGALAVLSECLAEEFKEMKIKVNCLALGAVQTEMLEKAFPGYKAPLSSKEMALFIKDFALNGHKFFNGKILPVSLSTP